MSRTVFAVLTLGCLALTLGACRDHPKPAEPGRGARSLDRPDVELGGNVIPRSHEVPPGRAAEIRRLFASGAMSYPIAVVSAQGAQTQFVNPTPVFVGGDRFVVGAPPHVHDAIDALIAGLGAGAAQTASTYELTFWVVEATPSERAEIAPELAELTPTLEGLAALGTRRFVGLDRAAVRTRDGASAKLAGRMLHVDHELSTGPDGLELAIHLSVVGAWGDRPEASPTVETTLLLPLDKAVVLGDSTQRSAADGTSTLLLYVVRARQVD